MSVDDITLFSDQNTGVPVQPQWGADASHGWRETEWRAFGSADGAFFGGRWSGEPGTLRCDPYPYDEVCIMLTGKVALIDEAGARREFGPGDAFFVPRSFIGSWETVEPSTKYFIALPATAGS